MPLSATSRSIARGEPDGFVKARRGLPFGGRRARGGLPHDRLDNKRAPGGQARRA